MRANTAPFIVLDGFGGSLKTTIVSPSPWNHCGLCRLAATAGGVWVLPEEHRILEDDFKMKRFRIQRVDWFDSGYMLKRSHMFYVKVDFGLVVGSRPALLYALVFSTLQTTSEIPIQPEHRSCGTVSCINWKIGPCVLTLYKGS